MPTSNHKKPVRTRKVGEAQHDRRLLQTLPCELGAPGRTRERPWGREWKYPESKGIILVRASASEEIRIGDLLTLISTTGLVQDGICAGRVKQVDLPVAGGKTIT
jgi:hypothetical protein